MPISLSGLRSAAGGALSGGGAPKGRMIIRNGRAYKMVPAGAKLQRRHKRGGARQSQTAKLMEYALIASLMRK